MELIESSSSWVIAMGKTLLNSLWIGLLILSLLKAFFLLIPGKLSILRYRASLLSLVVFSVLTTSLFLYLHTPADLQAGSNAGWLSLPVELSARSNVQYAGGNYLYQLVSLVYFSGMGIYLLTTLPALARIRKLRKDAAKISGRFDQLFTKLSAEAGFRRRVEFLVSGRITGPFLTGVLKPALIVPASMLTQLSFREVEAILMHEIYHLKKLDHVVNLLQQLIEILFFFNPAVRIISAIIRTEREKRCDDLVLSGPTGALVYARALYTLSSQDNSLGCRATAATGSGKGELISRIERILKPDTMKSNYREKLHTLLLFACGIGVVLLVSGFTSGFSIIRHNDEFRPAPETVSSTVTQVRPETINSSIPQAISEYSVPPGPIQDTLTEKEKEKIKEEVREAIEEARTAAMDEIDWEQIKKDMEEARLTIMEEIDWEEISKEMEELSFEAMEEIKEEMENIDWDQMKTDMADLRIQIDSMLADFDFDMDLDMDLDMDFDTLRKGNNNEDSKEEKR